jgi:hypothetical protein
MGVKPEREEEDNKTLIVYGYIIAGYSPFSAEGGGGWSAAWL